MIDLHVQYSERVKQNYPIDRLSYSWCSYMVQWSNVQWKGNLPLTFTNTKIKSKVTEYQSIVEVFRFAQQLDTLPNIRETAYLYWWSACEMTDATSASISLLFLIMDIQLQLCDVVYYHLMDQLNFSLCLVQGPVGLFPILYRSSKRRTFNNGANSKFLHRPVVPQTNAILVVMLTS